MSFRNEGFHDVIVRDKSGLNLGRNIEVNASYQTMFISLSHGQFHVFICADVAMREIL